MPYEAITDLPAPPYTNVWAELNAACTAARATEDKILILPAGLMTVDSAANGPLDFTGLTVRAPAGCEIRGTTGELIRVDGSVESGGSEGKDLSHNAYAGDRHIIFDAGDGDTLAWLNALSRGDLLKLGSSKVWATGQSLGTIVRVRKVTTSGSKGIVGLTEPLKKDMHFLTPEGARARTRHLVDTDVRAANRFA